jgi:hypothetical protein
MKLLYYALQSKSFCLAAVKRFFNNETPFQNITKYIVRIFSQSYLSPQLAFHSHKYVFVQTILSRYGVWL